MKKGQTETYSRKAGVRWAVGCDGATLATATTWSLNTVVKYSMAKELASLGKVCL